MDTTEVPPERPAGLARRPAAGVQDPGAGMRACSYHASPGVSKASVLCISLWMICLNTLVSRCAAVDERGCGKVDNYQKRQSSARLADLPLPMREVMLST